MTKHELAAKIQDTARQAFGDGKLANLLRGPIEGYGRAAATKEIKRVFHDLGRQLDYRVEGFGCAEFKYDLAWWAADADNYMTQLGLILESEFNKHNPKNGPVDIDFCKLVAGRADVRVWLSHAANLAAANDHIATCQKQVRRFADSRAGDTYIFIIFEWLTNQIVTQIWTNGPLCMSCCDRARRGEIQEHEIREAAATLRGDASGDTVHLCEACFAANCDGGMDVGDAVTFTNLSTMTLATTACAGVRSTEKERPPAPLER